MPRPSLPRSFALCALLAATTTHAATDAEWQTLEKILTPIQGVAAKPIEKVVTPKYTTGMLLGNGDIGVTVGSDNPNVQNFYFGKSNFWGTHWNPGHNAFENSILSLGGLTISSPQKSPATQPSPSDYKMEQDILHAEVRATLTLGNSTVNMRSFTADSDDLFITELSLPDNAAPTPVTLQLWLPGPNQHTVYPATASVDPEHNTLATTRKNNLHGIDEFQASAAVGLHILGANIEQSAHDPNSATATITLQPGRPVQLVAAFRSDARIGHLGPTPDLLLVEAAGGAATITPDDIAKLQQEHRDWWKNYWLKSFIQIDDKTLNEFYYGSLYVMGSATRANSPAGLGGERPYPPTLWANWITSDDAAWGGRYFLNYNAEAPFYGTFSSNRPDLVLPYADVIFAEFPWQKIKTANNGYQGVCFQRSLAPFHYVAEPPATPPVAPQKNYRPLQDQKSDGAFALIPAIWYWEYTHDDDYLRTKLYPALKELDAFHRDYVIWDKDKNGGGRWVVAHTAAHEEPQPWDTNTNLDLGFFRKITTTCLAASETLHTDENLRPVWNEFLAHLSPDPIGTYEDKPVYLMAEARGKSGAKLFGVGDQPINMEGTVFPGENLAIGGDAKLLQTARDSLYLMNCWGLTRGGNSNNGFCKEFPIAARVAWPPEDLLAKFKAAIQYQWRPTNLTVFQGGGGIETAGSIECLNSMMLQSEAGVVRIFPNWPKAMNARFTRLRAKGAFLVTAEQTNGNITTLEITSEKGEPLTLENPWPGQTPKIQSNNALARFTINADTLTIPTHPGETCIITP